MNRIVLIVFYIYIYILWIRFYLIKKRTFWGSLLKLLLSPAADWFLQPADLPVHDPAGHVHGHVRHRQPQGPAAVSLLPQANRWRDELRLPHGSPYGPGPALPGRWKVRWKVEGGTLLFCYHISFHSFCSPTWGTRVERFLFLGFFSFSTDSRFQSWNIILSTKSCDTQLCPTSNFS